MEPDTQHFDLMRVIFGFLTVLTVVLVAYAISRLMIKPQAKSKKPPTRAEDRPTTGDAPVNDGSAASAMLWAGRDEPKSKLSKELDIDYHDSDSDGGGGDGGD